jgi:hypothetical protein
MLECFDPHTRRGIACLVDDPSSENGAARQRHVDPFNCLARRDLEGPASFARTPLPVLDREVASTRGSERIGAGEARP